MIDPISFLLLLLVSVGLSHVVLPRHRFMRLLWSTAPGVLLLFITHQGALLLAVVTLLVSTGVYLTGRSISNSRIRTRLPYAILLLLFVPDLIALAETSPLLFLGSAFFIVRQMMTVAQALKRKIRPGRFAPAVLMATFFVAALPSGPVYNGVDTWEELEAAGPADNRQGLYRLFEGFVYLFALGGIADVVLSEIRQGGQTSESLASALAMHGLLLPLAGFALLFTTFYGYSRMAEGTALLLGFSVPQNFDRPHLASDLSDFWRRWHRSMADFVMQYIYLPLLVTTKQAKIALLAAFVFMGLWHHFSFAFLVWGVGHGVGLGVVLPWARRSGLGPLLIRTASLVWVLALSSLAHGVWL